MMIVEDNKTIANQYALLLSNLGAQPEICRDGDIANGRFDENLPAPRVIFLDLFLPGRDGGALLDQIEANPKFNETRIVIVTAFPSYGLELQQKHPHVNRVIAKPIDVRDFQAEIAMCA